MQWYEILLIVLACAFVIGVVTWRVIRKKQGKSGCDCGGDCGGNCAHCAAHMRETAQKPREK